MTNAASLSAEARVILRDWCAQQREKYGDDWKAILAKEMAEKTAPVIGALVRLTQKPQP